MDFIVELLGRRTWIPSVIFFTLQIGMAQCRNCALFLMNVAVAAVSATMLCRGLVLCVILVGWDDTTLSELMLVLLFSVVFPTSHFLWVALLRGFI